MRLCGSCIEWRKVIKKLGVYLLSGRSVNLILFQLSERFMLLV